jgi:hypothetical protein
MAPTSGNKERETHVTRKRHPPQTLLPRRAKALGGCRVLLVSLVSFLLLLLLGLGVGQAGALGVGLLLSAVVVLRLYHAQHHKNEYTPKEGRDEP